MLRKLYLLLWKNLLHFKRHPILTAFEIILPCFLVILLAFLKAVLPTDVNPGSLEYGNGTGNNNTNYDPNENTGLPGSGGRSNNNPDSNMDIVFPEYNETVFIEKLAQKFNLSSLQKDVILYTPKSEAAERIIGKLVERIDRFLNATERLAVNITDFSNEKKMVNFNFINLRKGGFRRRSPLNIPFGLVFDGLSGNDVGPKVSYKIRMNHKFKTDILMNPDYHPATYGRNKYIKSGFIGIQYLLDEILIEEYTNNKLPSNTFSLQAFPYPPSKVGAYVNKGATPKGIKDGPILYLPVCLVIGFVLIVPQVMKGVVSEKETGIKELMKMSGLPEWMHWLGWMLHSLAILTVTVIIIVFFLFYPFNSTNGAVFEHSDVTLFWTVLMIYMIWAITYCFVVAACFEKTTLATKFGIAIWLVSYFILAMPMGGGYGKDFSTELKLLLCLFPNVAIALATKAIIGFEIAANGSKWENINQTIPSIVDISLLYIILMFLVSICLNIILCLYIEAVFPKTYGVRKPFYFLFLPSEWRFSSRVSPSPLANDSSSTANKKPGFEDDPSGINAGIQITNLRKEFGDGKVAVNDLTMNIFEGQILCLLGQNGAGKTTTMSILTGLIPPTSGTAFIDGYDIRTNMNKIRENLGLCPQHNMLFDEMTVIEHLRFFGMLKGLSLKNAAKEGGDLVRVLQMEKKKDVLSKNLSGGQKRRLQLGCALIGGSKVIFLDEPTSGLDPEGRRALWNILLKIRGERTIVLTTHYMEEADVLGDRIAILSNGILQCCGTTNFLKRFYGAGYTLNMTLTDGANREEILQTVCKYIEDAHLKASHSNNATELSIALPSDSNTTAKFPDLFSELRKEQNKLHIDEIGVGWTTMDEVFVRVEELSHQKEVTNNEPTAHQNGTGPSNELGPKHDKLTGLKLATNQFYGLLLKKLFQTKRQKRLIFTQMLVPILLTIAVISIGGTIDKEKDSEANPALKMSMSSYKRPVTLYSSENKALGDSYAKVVGSSAQPLDSSYSNNLSLGLLAVGRKDAADYHERYIVAAQLNDTNMKGMHSILAYHSASLSLTLLTNTFLQSNGKGNEVEITNHPFQQNSYGLLHFDSHDPTVVMTLAVLLSVGLMLFLGTFIVGPTEEKISKGKQLQLMTGVNPFLYWSSSFICDMLIVLFLISLMTACVPIFEWNKMFTNHDGAGALFLIITAYALASIPFTYIFSTFVKGASGGFSIVTIINFVACVFLGLPSYTLEDNGIFNPNGGFAVFLRTIGRLFPTFGFTKASMDYFGISIHNSFCYKVPKKTLDLLCDPDLKLDNDTDVSKIQSCCANCAVLDKCHETLSYFRWTKEVEQRVRSNSTPSAPIIHHVPALAQNLVWLIIMAVIYFAILMIIEYGVCQRLVEIVKGIFKKKYNFRSTIDDSDVLEENERVSQLVKTSTSSEDAMVVDNLCKSFGGSFCVNLCKSFGGSFSAVSELSFGVHHGECFGLLGVNGAGKTTTFRMLTGDENPSNGNAYMNNVSLASGRKRFLSILGYCPQFDGFVEGLSGKEMLLLFARLRGIPGNRVEEEADKWLERTGLTASANVQCKKYSGGMKRRLSTAMALIGDPAVILLDEPTCGVDPVARRQFWKIITSIKNSGQAIILTSHSMEECEALCSRLGIMVNGQMQCLGGVQHLKNKFAQGYSLNLKLKENALQDNGNVQAITESILQNFQPSSLKDHHQTTMKFQIHSRSLSWEELYGRMEKIKTDFQELIEEYVITETTLEEVFMSFARKQKVTEKGMMNSGISLPGPVGSSVSGTNSLNSETNNSTVSFNPETKNPGVTSVDTTKV